MKVATAMVFTLALLLTLARGRPIHITAEKFLEYSGEETVCET
jgi:hypothetical protein